MYLYSIPHQHQNNVYHLMLSAIYFVFFYTFFGIKEIFSLKNIPFSYKSCTIYKYISHLKKKSLHMTLGAKITCAAIPELPSNIDTINIT